MKKYIFRAFCLFAVLGLALVAIFLPEFSAEAFAFLGVGGSSSMMLGAQFSGASTFKNANDLSPTLIDRYVHERVTTRRANDVPLDTIMRNIRKPERASSFNVEFLEHEYRGFQDAVNGAVSANASSPSGDVIVDNGAMWGKDDLIRVPSIAPAGAAATGDELVMIVTAVSGNTLSVTTLNNNDDLPAISDNVVIYKSGNAKGERDATTSIILSNPATLSNYAQIFMAQIEQTVYDKLSKKVGGFSYKNYVDEVIFNYKSDVASAQVFNPVKAKYTVGTVEKYITQGIYAAISNTINFGTGSGAVNPSLTDIYNLGKAVFAGKDASDSKILCGGSDLINGLTLIDKYQRDLSAKEQVIFHGVRVSKLTTPYGDIKVVYDPLMDKHGKSNEAMVLDLSHVYRHELKPLEATPLDLDKTGVARVTGAMRWDEASCLTLRYGGPEGVHAVWKPTA